MTAYPIPDNEQERLGVLRSLSLDYSAPMPELQKLAGVAANIARTPIALVSLVDEDAQKFVANIGLEGTSGTPREVSFCAHAIVSSHQFVVPDAGADPRFKDSPLVTGAPHIGSYAGSVIETGDMRLGTLCVIDTKPRDFPPDVLAQLDDLSDAATALLLAHRDRLALRERLRLEERLQAALRDRAYSDPLTGLLNQAGFREKMDNMLGRAQGMETLVVIDIDHFKHVNDRWGHPFGDRYLQAIGQGLCDGFGPDAIVGRIGGDEFAALLPAGDRKAQEASVERARSLVHSAAVDMGKPELGRLSAGLCPLADAPERSFEGLYQKADVALYAAKERGRNSNTWFSRSLDEIYNIRSLRVRFADALARGEIRPHFQPKVDLSDGRIVGFELLARWHDPVRGVLMPGQFHKVLTDASVGPALTTRMIAGAIAALKEPDIPAATLPRMAVNITHHDLGDPGFIEETDWVLSAAGLGWQNLAFEVTETAILNDTDRDIRNSLEEIRRRGGEIALDDFGTGHAGLLHLRDWPIDILKLDATFVRGIAENTRDEAIVSALVGLAHRLGLVVVAEGIETTDTACKLRDMGCEIGQGFLFSAAVERPSVLQSKEYSRVLQVPEQSCG